MPNTARPIETLPGMPDAADLRECASRRPPITYQQLLAERAGLSVPGRTGTDRANRNQRGEQNRSKSAFSLGTLPFDEPKPQGPVSIVLPWSTLHSINGMFTIVGKEYQGAKLRARAKIGEQLGDIHPGAWQPMTCRVAVEVVLVCPDRRPRDLDNYEKLIYDALKALVYRDDSLIDDKRIRRDYDVDRPRAEITVTPIGAQP